MSVTLSGTIHGRRIDLDQESPMPDGAAVTVRIAARSLTEKEKRRLVVVTSGAWADDPSIARLFEEVAERRRDIVPRDGAA